MTKLRVRTRGIPWIAAGPVLVAWLGLAPTAGAASDGSVAIQGFEFLPATLTLTLDVANGNHVTFVNQDPANHLAHFGPNGFHQPQAGIVSPCFGTGVIPPGQSWTATLDSKCAQFAGASGLSLQYHCHIHPDMVASIRILET